MRITLSHDAFNTQSLKPRCKSNGTVGINCLDISKSPIGSHVRLRIFTYAFPPPMMKTSVSNVARPSKRLLGEYSKFTSSDWTSKLSSLVLKIQIFHSTESSFFTGRRTNFPLHTAAGELVLNNSPQSINCCAHKKVSVLSPQLRCQKLRIMGSQESERLG